MKIVDTDNRGKNCV